MFRMKSTMAGCKKIKYYIFCANFTLKNRNRSNQTGRWNREYKGTRNVCCESSRILTPRKENRLTDGEQSVLGPEEGEVAWRGVAWHEDSDPIRRLTVCIIYLMWLTVQIHKIEWFGTSNKRTYGRIRKCTHGADWKMSKKILKRQLENPD
jgi:hypothetical protein